MTRCELKCNKTAAGKADNCAAINSCGRHEYDNVPPAVGDEVWSRGWRRRWRSRLGSSRRRAWAWVRVQSKDDPRHALPGRGAHERFDWLRCAGRGHRGETTYASESLSSSVRRLDATLLWSCRDSSLGLRSRAAAPPSTSPSALPASDSAASALLARRLKKSEKRFGESKLPRPLSADARELARCRSLPNASSSEERRPPCWSSSAGARLGVESSLR